ncbi:MAG TPA: hypothetical protein PLO51_01030, partial [Candidatus Micrarchaeota archaeon]|nr:hypothetical protein [Candidatus Micrarchaeota archaeon]
GDGTKPPVPALLSPLNMSSRVSPFAYCGPTQAVYFGKAASDGTNTNLFLLWNSFGPFQTGVEYSVVSKDGQGTKTAGATAKLTSKGILGGNFSTGARLTTATTSDGKSSTNIDAGASLSQFANMPVSVAASFGPSQNSQSICIGGESWVATGIRKEAKTGNAFSGGFDYQAKYSAAISQRFYASYEYSVSDSKKTFVAGSRLFVPFGNLELNYERVMPVGSMQPQNNISFRVGYYIE